VYLGCGGWLRVLSFDGQVGLTQLLSHNLLREVSLANNNNRRQLH
jgi:hypothetical protein